MQASPIRTAPHQLGRFALSTVETRPSLDTYDFSAMTFWALHVLGYRTIEHLGARKSPSDDDDHPGMASVLSRADGDDVPWGA